MGAAVVTYSVCNSHKAKAWTQAGGSESRSPHLNQRGTNDVRFAVQASSYGLARKLCL